MGLINEVKIPVQELGGQRGEGAYFRENTVYDSNAYVCINRKRRGGGGEGREGNKERQ